MDMASYSGMTLKGEIRESISLDDDDLSDVEDEVFIRDGKNGYKLAEELTVKRPLMAPRKRAARSEIRTVLKRRSNCKSFCKPCCYLYIALSIFIGLITLVVVIVSLYPLPLEKLKEWPWKRSPKDLRLNLLPCNNLRITDVWTMNFPKLTSDSSVRTLDVNNDGVEDILFGFGTGNNSNAFPPDIFCPIFMGVSPPCEGGVIALNGINGDVLWTRWLNDNVFRLQCVFDIDGDQLNDCLAVGTEGTLMTINSRNGTPIWQLNADERNLYVASFISDQNNDSIPDVLASYSSLSAEKDGHIVLLSGKNGEELQKLNTPNGTKTFYMPQVLTNSKGSFVLFGTGTSISSGNLSALPLSDITSGKIPDQLKTLYEDKSKGVFNPSILVDITGDNVTDIVTSMYRSVVVAINGETFEQIWNFTVPGNDSETEITPTPGYFNSDNCTDFLVVYQTLSNDTNKTSTTQVFIIDGKTGKLLDNPSNDSIRTQISGLTLGMEDHGYDMFLFWTNDCDKCRNQSNRIDNIKLNALSQFHQPPGFTIYNAVDRLHEELDDIPSSVKQLREYFKHSKKNLEKLGQAETNEKYNTDQRPIVLRKYGSTNFKAKQRIDDDDNTERKASFQSPDYKWSPATINQNLDFNDYLGPLDENYNADESDLLNKGIRHSSNRDPRNKDEAESSTKSMKTKKKNLSDGLKGIYDPKNIRSAKNRLLHDLDHPPTDILKDTFVKNEERRLRKSKFEQRDVGTHYDKFKEKQEIQKIIQDELKAATTHYNLWDIESEKELQEKDISKFRGKRKAAYVDDIHRVTSVGAIVDSLNTTNGTNSSIDIVFLTYWEPPAITQDDLLKQDIEECVALKLSLSTKGSSQKADKVSEEDKKTKYRRDCTEEQQNLKEEFNYFNKLSRLKFGKLSVHRLRIECECLTSNNVGTCSKFLSEKQQSWPSHLGQLGNGMFLTRP